MERQVFNSKLLLFGEYGLMYGAKALSVPFSRFSGFLDIGDHQESNAEILKFYTYLKAEGLPQKLHFGFDLERLESDLAGGLYFNSNIPLQYGVGSSGALVAALFARYVVGSIPESELSPERLKSDFSILESFFHGKSSGIDPLISFMNKPMLIDGQKVAHELQFDLEKAGFCFALIDTKTTGATGPLVEYFIGQLHRPEFKTVFDTQFVPANNGCIDSLLANRTETFFLNLEQLVRFQLGHFQRMIPGNFHGLISSALNERVFIKLLGSGGGGFLLAISEEKSRLTNWAKKHNVDLEMVGK